MTFKLCNTGKCSVINSFLTGVTGLDSSHFINHKPFSFFFNCSRSPNIRSPRQALPQLSQRQPPRNLSPTLPNPREPRRTLLLPCLLRHTNARRRALHTSGQTCGRAWKLKKMMVYLKRTTPWCNFDRMSYHGINLNIQVAV